MFGLGNRFRSYSLVVGSPLLTFKNVSLNTSDPMIGNLPCCKIRVIISFEMLSNIFCCRISIWITRNLDVTGILVNPDIVESHGRWHKLSQIRQENCCKTVGQPKIHNDRHGFLGDDPLPDVAIWSYCTMVHMPGVLVPHKPGNVTRVTWDILKPISLISISIIPLVIQPC
jgi:hypothetical protein